MATLISMENTAQEAQEQVSPTADAPKYPWGLSLCLNSEVLEKLGVTTLPEVGSEVRLLAKAVVTGASQDATESGTRNTVDLQITDMQCEGMQSDLMASAAKVLYGSK